MLSHLRRRCLVAAVLLLVPAAGRAQDRSSGILDEDRPEVVGLTITGVRSIDEGQLRAAINTDASRCRSIVYRFTLCPFYKGDAVYVREYFDPTEFRRDVLRIKLFYYQRGFRQTQVDTTITRTGVDEIRVAFAVTEGEPTRVDSVVVERAGGLIPRRRRARLLRIAKGDPVNLLQIDSTVVAVREALANRGFADAEVGSRVSVDTSARIARVTIAIDPKRRATVDSIDISGNDRVTDETIRHSLRLKEGDIFRVSDLVESQRVLYESGLFRRADITAIPPTDTTRPQVDSAKKLLIAVQEALPRAVRTSVGFNTFEFFQAGTRYTNYNLLGGSRRLDVNAAIGNIGSEQLNRTLIFRNPQLTDSSAGRYFSPTYQASIDVTQRWVGDPRNTISAGVFAQRRSSPLVFVDRSYGASATATREVATRVPVSLSYRFEVSGVESGDVYFCVNFGICDRQSIDVLNTQQKLSPLTLTGLSDRSNDVFSPTRGFRLRADVEHASRFTISDFRYNRLTAEGSYYRPTFGGTLATRVRVGLIRALGSANEAIGITTGDQSLIHPRKRFYAGGAQSVRGYGENQLGPRVLTIPSSVLRGEFTENGVTQYAYCPMSDPISSCNPNPAYFNDDFPGLSDTAFIARPVGGDQVLEANVEYRFPLFPRLNLSGAVFVDGAIVGASYTRLSENVAAVTPGFGIRYLSPVGPIRIDVGLNPSLSEDLRVITESDDGESRGLIELQGTVNPDGSTLTPATRRFASYERPGVIGRALGRLVLHLSIGEAF